MGDSEMEQHREYQVLKKMPSLKFTHEGIHIIFPWKL